VEFELGYTGEREWLRHHKPSKLLRLSTINAVASRKPDTRSLH